MSLDVLFLIIIIATITIIAPQATTVQQAAPLLRRSGAETLAGERTFSGNIPWEHSLETFPGNILWKHSLGTFSGNIHREHSLGTFSGCFGLNFVR